MSDPQAKGHFPPHETSASPQRPAQRLAGPRLAFDLARELQSLRREESWEQGDRNAKTLVKEPPLRLTLAVLKKGAQLAAHMAEGPVTVQVLEGQLALTVDGEPIELSSGQILAIEPGIRHDVTALDESAFLLTIGLPSGTAA